MSVIKITPQEAEIAKLMVKYAKEWKMEDTITPGIRAMAEAKPTPRTNVLETMEEVRELPPKSVVKLVNGEWAQIALHYIDPPLTSLAFRFGSGYSIELQPKHLPLTVIERARS